TPRHADANSAARSSLQPRTFRLRSPTKRSPNARCNSPSPNPERRLHSDRPSPIHADSSPPDRSLARPTFHPPDSAECSPDSDRRSPPRHRAIRPPRNLPSPNPADSSPPDNPPAPQNFRLHSPTKRSPYSPPDARSPNPRFRLHRN